MSISETDLQIDDVLAGFNLTSSNQSTFLLMGIPSLENANVWIAIPFAMSYIITLLGNFTILFVVVKDQTLHQPMYLLICMLALTDITKSTSILPKTLDILWFNLKNVTTDGCVIQMFFLYTFAFMQSAILVIMAFDRYVAICNPLRYTSILSNARIAILGIVGLMRSLFLTLFLPLFLTKLPLYANCTITHTNWENMIIAKLAWGDITANSIWTLLIAFTVSGLDLMLIALSYGLIIRAVLKISSARIHQKALNTCTTHICVMLTSYIPGYFNALAHWYGQVITPHIHILLGSLYLLIPPMLNPIIYGLRTKELRDKMCKCIRRV